ncbi:MAG TPA: sigma-54 dependent transcriptional regulator [Candidatus Marinimicrobia bacterium]|jgi:DNA-binding NtrC family response regulator|nr:sigma-54-dependent Fis family transcriptional regulator [Candidatus Neomarinimicrobiota bacterium]MDP6296516.1 sigma-54 dependent transcriptional regulator [Candidatus Neomarinimicrobiota bacterium]MDP7121144.1 sigma-54 dependent transcriptional regulator [Candidatus Neomarinimicrobiota bacterium]MDP7483031.1 sigma-54 dependent transcriptional regulator [Candidatus Neomarinimicrobiota bacterium]MDP7528763.1 sigma-54 dependent transcriptional regulator [Candidatus Neomarinimicrobiota bacteriu|tara:strand:+ start:1079 stop:2281 length:1203 start_codon:yes stop_codon:yes gene_type:complete
MSDLERVRRDSGIIGTSEGIEQVLEMIVQIAPVDISVLITGESGTGKEMVAKAIHKQSRRPSKPLVTVNCGAIPEGIIESELFGHKKGAFTGAAEDRKGYFEEADNGTVFLDEIGEMPVETQVKLLRVLESGEFMRVGDAKTRKVDVRMIAATNKNLAEESDKGRFRRDLYYRLRTVTIDVPPLRQRMEDIDLLTERFALLFSRSNDIVFRGFSSDAIRVMKQYDWPGNIRELRNFVESVILLEKGNKISSEMVLKHLEPMVGRTSSNLPVPVDKSSGQAERELILQQLLFLRQDMREIKGLFSGGQIDRSGEVGYIDSGGGLNFSALEGDVGNLLKSAAIGDMSVKDLEVELISRTLKKFNNNRRKTARALGISERTLYRKINDYGLEKKQKRFKDTDA